MRTRLRHYCNARSSFFQSVKTRVHFFRQIAQQLEKYGKMKRGMLEFNYIKVAFFPTTETNKPVIFSPE